MIEAKDKPIANPLMVLREEFDDWAILFDPDTGYACGLNPTGVFTFKHLDGHHTVEEIIQKLRNHFEDATNEADKEVTDFIQKLIDKGYVGFKVAEGIRYAGNENAKNS